MSSLALSDSFEYLCYGYTAIRNIFTLTVRGSNLVAVRVKDYMNSDKMVSIYNSLELFIIYLCNKSYQWRIQ